MLVAIDTKNLSLYNGGISALLRTLIKPWILASPDLEFVFVGPEFDYQDLMDFQNTSHHIIPWPLKLYRPLRHPYYDNFLFPKAIKEVKPDFIYTPYHDLRLPKHIPSVMSIHDTCLKDMKGIYPNRLRYYYEMMLRLNLRRAKHILTGTEASLQTIIERYKVERNKITIIPNTVDKKLLFDPLKDMKYIKPESVKSNEIKMIYTGGSEYRKNIKSLVASLESLEDSGQSTKLWVTGECDQIWHNAIKGLNKNYHKNITFLGRLSFEQLKIKYLQSDLIIYPSLCEGFGRAVLEAKMLGKPIACSDLPCLREVGKNYPVYFSPYDIADMVSAIKSASMQKQLTPEYDERYDRKNVAETFNNFMNKFIKDDA